MRGGSLLWISAPSRVLAKHIRRPGNRRFGRDVPDEKPVNPFAPDIDAKASAGASVAEIRERDQQYFDQRDREVANRSSREEVAAFFQRQKILRSEPLRLQAEAEMKRADAEGGRPYGKLNDTRLEKENNERSPAGLIDERDIFSSGGIAKTSTASSTYLSVVAHGEDDELYMKKFLQRLCAPEEERRHNFQCTNSLDPDFKAKERLPWRIRRTSFGNFAVYERFKRGGIEAYTVLRNVEGNIRSLRKQLIHVCEAPVRVRVGCFEIRGLHSWKLKEWLASLGF
ncbi:unnamed protein product [Amoebophrya sp. A25]|nr:unnamed protein product [Amoebophrya sp. A25]|eukprot:GSA25T00010934001.1